MNINRFVSGLVNIPVEFADTQLKNYLSKVDSTAENLSAWVIISYSELIENTTCFDISCWIVDAQERYIIYRSTLSSKDLWPSGEVFLIKKVESLRYGQMVSGSAITLTVSLQGFDMPRVSIGASDQMCTLSFLEAARHIQQRFFDTSLVFDH